MGRGRRRSHTRRSVPAGREPRHAGPGRPFRGLARRPLAVALLCGGLLIVGGGAAGLLLLRGHQGPSPQPVAHPGRPPAGVVAGPPPPVTVTRVIIASTVLGP